MAASKRDCGRSTSAAAAAVDAPSVTRASGSFEASQSPALSGRVRVGGTRRTASGPCPAAPSGANDTGSSTSRVTISGSPNGDRPGSPTPALDRVLDRHQRGAGLAAPDRLQGLADGRVRDGVAAERRQGEQGLVAEGARRPEVAVRECRNGRAGQPVGRLVDTCHRDRLSPGPTAAGAITSKGDDPLEPLQGIHRAVSVSADAWRALTTSALLSLARRAYQAMCWPLCSLTTTSTTRSYWVARPGSRRIRAPRPTAARHDRPGRYPSTTGASAPALLGPFRRPASVTSVKVRLAMAGRSPPLRLVVELAHGHDGDPIGSFLVIVVVYAGAAAEHRGEDAQAASQARGHT